MAGRRDPNVWCAIVRCGPCKVYARPNSLKIDSVTYFPTADAALVFIKDFEAKLAQERSSPCFLAFFARVALFFDTLLTTTTMPGDDDDARMLIQPLIPGERVFVWSEANTGYVQMYNAETAAYISSPPPRLQGVLSQAQYVLSDMPNVFLICILNHEAKRTNLYVYDAVYFPQTSSAMLGQCEQAKFTDEPVDVRLSRLRNILYARQREHLGLVIDVAPFQIAATRGEARDHMKIYAAGGFPVCGIRLLE